MINELIDIEKIVKQAECLHKETEDKNLKQLIDDYTYLYEKVPVLFYMAKDKKDLSLLYIMADKIKKIQSGKVNIKKERKDMCGIINKHEGEKILSKIRLDENGKPI